MSGNLLDGMFGATTQTIDSVKALAEYLGIEGDLPETLVLANGARLVLSSKKDAYYTVTRKGCSCKGFIYRRTCKHVRGQWATGGNGPVMPEDRPKASSLSKAKMLIDVVFPNTTPGECAYWQHKQAQEA